MTTIVEYSAVNFMIYHTDPRFQKLGIAVDEFFRTTMPILWLLILLFSLVFFDSFGARVTMAVLTLIWVAAFIVEMVRLVRKNFYKPPELSE